MIHDGLVLLPSVDRDVWIIECDSSLKAGGAHSPSGYYAAEYTEHMLQKTNTIAHLELALKALSPMDPHRFIVQGNPDNMTSQQVLGTGTGRDSTLCACACEIRLFLAQHSTQVVINL